MSSYAYTWVIEGYTLHYWREGNVSLHKNKDEFTIGDFNETSFLGDIVMRKRNEKILNILNERVRGIFLPNRSKKWNTKRDLI